MLHVATPYPVCSSDVRHGARELSAMCTALRSRSQRDTAQDSGHLSDEHHNALKHRSLVVYVEYIYYIWFLEAVTIV